MGNLTFDHGLLKEHTPEPLEGHAVVVFRRVGQAGEEVHSVLVCGGPRVRPGLRLASRISGKYFAYAVDTAPERHLEFSEAVHVDDLAHGLRIAFSVSYAVSDPVGLARARSVDPLRVVRDRIRVVIGREFEQMPSRAAGEAFLRHARDLVDHHIEELREFAGGYGIAIHSIRLTARFRATVGFQEIRSPSRLSHLRGKFAARLRWLREAAKMTRRQEPASRRGGGDEPRHPELRESSASVGEAAATEPAAGPEPVLLGGSAPRTARPGDVILAQFVAYVARFEAKARQALEREADAGEIRLGEQTDCRWAAGVRVIVRCRANGLVVPTPVQGFVWNGECRSLSFDLEVPADARPRDTVIVFEAFVGEAAHGAPDPVEVGRLRIPIDITLQEEADRSPQRVAGEAARKAFASYDSEDRADVLERVSSIRRSTGMEVWMDIVDLRMGEQWETALRENIAVSDRFLLFWSDHAARSEWVDREWRQAVAMKGEEVLELHLLRQTPIETIPEPLRKFHFNDIYLVARDAELYRRSQAGDAQQA